MIFTAEDRVDFGNETTCHICDEEGFSSEYKHDLSKVADHCHYTGRYRGTAHYRCNLLFKIPKCVPIIVHNLQGYDCHLLVEKLGGKIKCIAINGEQYISINKEIVIGTFTNKDGQQIPEKRELRFIDSLKFMSSSLETLVQNLDKDDCISLKKYF